MLAALFVAAADLFAAIQAQDLPTVRVLLQKDPSLVNARDRDGRSAVSAALGVQAKEGFLPRAENHVLDAVLAAHPQLSPMEVCAVGDADEVRALLLAQAKFVATVFANGWTPLHAAAFGGNTLAARLLLDAGADVDARARNRFANTPLQVALLTRSREVARLLLSRGAAVNATQNEGVTALHEAAQSGDVEMIRALLAAGADPRVSAGKFGTPRDLALKAGHAEAARLLAP
jgi:ankyrin repeat protein